MINQLDYIEGYKKKQYELLGIEENENTYFCKNCFQNGVINAKIGIWAPPLTLKLGHYDSYEKGYYELESKQEYQNIQIDNTDLNEKIYPTPIYLPSTRLNIFFKYKKYIIITLGTLALVVIVYFFIVKFTINGKSLVQLLSQNTHDSTKISLLSTDNSKSDSSLVQKQITHNQAFIDSQNQVSNTEINSKS